jgi:hypothetical protein
MSTGRGYSETGFIQQILYLYRSLMYRSAPLFTLQFLLISNKFYDFILLQWPLFGAVYCRDAGGRGQCGKKDLMWPWKLATIPLYNPLKSPTGTQKLVKPWASD